MVTNLDTQTRRMRIENQMWRLHKDGSQQPANNVVVTLM
jgi:hypothetical protein